MAVFFTLIFKTILIVKMKTVRGNKVEQTSISVSNFIKFIKTIYKAEEFSFLTSNARQIFI